MRCEYVMVTRDGKRIQVQRTSRDKTANTIRRLKADNQSKATLAKSLFAITLVLFSLLVGVTIAMGNQINQLNREISEMADTNLQQVTAISEEYRDLYSRYRDVQVENLELQDIVAKYEEILPFVNGSLDYYNPSVPLDGDLQAATWRIGSMYGIEPEILYAVMRKESGFNPTAVSGDGHDYGICQIRDVNHGWLQEELGPLDFMNPEDSITAAAYILADIRDTYGYSDWNHILVAYNMGPGNAKNYFAKGNTSSSYSRLVLQYAAEYGYTV
ncbi:MAG: lytic transglycosylase domain-containing protein [Lachnospiraceae bacterium]|nr:lytic transglycosylase domain-containing protein [Lachnospiraceae bacterium]